MTRVFDRDVLSVLPVSCIIGFALLVLIIDLFMRQSGREKDYRIFLLLTGCIYAWAFSGLGYYANTTACAGLLFVDAYGFVLSSIILGCTVITLLFHHRYLEGERVRAGVDADVLLMFVAAGGVLMVSAANLIVLFIGFEMLSLSAYVLTGTAKGERGSAEGALKYFVLGAFSSAFLLYGIALIYGAAGGLELSVIHKAAYFPNTLLLVGLGFLVFGFCFKASIVPFHFWTPDVYQGAPTSVTGFMASAIKTAAFGSALRVLLLGFGGMRGDWAPLFYGLAVVTMTLGNFAALQQTSIKRLLAYSSIAHAGYLSIGLVVGGEGSAAMVFYLLVYSLMTLASFGVVLVVTSGSEAQYEKDDIVSLSGIGWSHPFLGLVMLIALLSLAGIPPLGGFFAKLYLFSAALRGGYVWLTVIAVLNSVVALYYYLRVVVVMYLTGDRKLNWSPPQTVSLAASVALTLSVAGIVYLGVCAEDCLVLVRMAVGNLL